MERTYYIYKGKKYPNRLALEKYLNVVENKFYDEARNISGNAQTITVNIKPKTKKKVKNGQTKTDR